MSETTNVLLPEKTAADFELWYIAHYYPTYENISNYLLADFAELHFDFRSGVLCAYLREYGIDIEIPKHKERQVHKYQLNVYLNDLLSYSEPFSIYVQALIAAITAGMNIRETQFNK